MNPMQQEKPHWSRPQDCLEQKSGESEVLISNEGSSRYQTIAPLGGTLLNYNNSGTGRRIGRACDECRRKKIKCYTTEGSSLCKHCITNSKGCTYNSIRKKRGPPKGNVELLEGRLKRIEGLLGNISHDVDTSKSEDVLLPAKVTAKVTASQAVKTTNKSNKIKEAGKKNFNNINGGESNEELIEKIKNAHLTNEVKFVSGNNASYFWNRSSKLTHTGVLSRHGINIHHSKNNDYFFIKKTSPPDDIRRAQIHQLIEVGLLRPDETIKNIDDWILKVSGIDKSLSNRLLKIYFAYIHPLLPVINKQSFLEEYRQIRTSFPAGPLLNAVYCAALRYVENCKRFDDADRLDEGEPWNYPENLPDKMFHSLIVFIKGKYSPCLSSIQAIVIMHNHCANVENFTSGWLLNCVAVRMSQDIGLHRSTEGWNISPQEKETRRMVWWAVYTLDRWFSAATGRPLTAFDEDCDELFPSENVSMDETMDIKTEHDQHLPRFPSLDEKEAQKVTHNHVPLNQPFVQLLKLSQILGLVLQGLYTPKAKKHSAQHGSDAIVAFLDDALSNWRASLPPLLEISNAGKRNAALLESRIPLLTMSGLICLSYCTVLILLHRPFIEKNSTTNKNTKLSSQSSLTICTSAAIRIVEIAETMHYRDFLLISWNFALNPVFTASLIHIYNSSNSDTIVSDVAKSNLVRSLAVIDKLTLLSPTAASLATILKKVISKSPIFVNDPEFVKMVNIRKDILPLTDKKSGFSLSPTAKSPVTATNSGNASPELLPSFFFTKSSNERSSKRKKSSNEKKFVHDKSDNSNEKSFQKASHINSLTHNHNVQKSINNTVSIVNKLDNANMQGNEYLNKHVNKKKRILDSTSTPVWDEEDWLNQLYTPVSIMQQQQQPFSYKDASALEQQTPPIVCYSAQHQYKKQTSNIDAYSIRQFGFTMNNNSQYATGNILATAAASNNNEPLSAYNSNNPTTLPPSSIPNQNYPHFNNNNHNTDYNSLSETATAVTVPLISSALFEFSDLTSPYYGTPFLNHANMHLFHSNNQQEKVTDAIEVLEQETVTNNSNLQQQPLSMMNNMNVANASDDPSALFKYRPDNPFWAMPNSIEVEDWHAYLMPKQ